MYVQGDSKLLSGCPWPINLKPKNKIAYEVWKCKLESLFDIAVLRSIDVLIDWVTR
jgi:hypothetical protein